MRAFRWLLVVLVFVGSAGTAAAYSGIDFFGDSLLDVGNVWAATSHLKPLCADKDGAYWQGRFCNGPNYADQLSARFGLPYPTPFALGGNNCAWGGAGTATSGYSTLGTPNLGTQVTGYLAALNGSQIDPNRLVVVWAGGNDPIYEGQMDYTQSVANIVDAVSRLANQGAKNILVNNLPLLGKTPTALRQSEEVQTGLNNWTMAFDATLASSLATLRISLAPSNVTILEAVPGQDDICTKFNKIIADPSLYVITNVTDQAYQTTDSGILGKRVPNSDNYLFWDFVHPTTYAVSVIVPEPSALIMLIITGTGGFLAVMRRRRHATLVNRE